MAKEKLAVTVMDFGGVSCRVSEYEGHPLLVVDGPVRKDGTPSQVMAGAAKIRNVLKHGVAIASDFYGSRVAESFAAHPTECAAFLEAFSAEDGRPPAPAPAPAKAPKAPAVSAAPDYAPAAKAKAAARGASAKRFVPVVAVASAPVATVPAPGAGVTAVAAEDVAAKAAAIIARIRAGLPLA